MQRFSAGYAERSAVEITSLLDMVNSIDYNSINKEGINENDGY
jgi:hypothetical protein